jgi:hypothetical protein
VGDTEGDGVGVRDREGVGESEGVGDTERVGEREGVSEDDREGVGESEGEGDRERVGEDDREGVGEGEGDVNGGLHGLPAPSHPHTAHCYTCQQLVQCHWGSQVAWERRQESARDMVSLDHKVRL